MKMHVRVLVPGLLLAFCAMARGADVAASASALAGLRSYLEQPGRPPLEGQAFAATPLMKEDARAAQALLWADHAARVKSERAREMEARRLRDEVNPALEMPFAYTVFGEKPKNGRSLFISMHGGGNAAPAVNDRQYENQKRLYQPAEGVYLAPRAPTNTWNLWHEAHIDRLFGRLIENLIVFEEVDPNRIYLMGYSAGGDGVYQLAPRMADRFAAASMMAGHPNDASPLGLRNLPFSIHVGALDNGFNRNRVAMEWEAKLANLRRDDLEGYIHWVKLYDGKPHWMDREDAAAVPWMAAYTRNPLPRKVVWSQGHSPHTRFYWLAVEAGATKHGTTIMASRAGQQITVVSQDVQVIYVRLNDEMVDLDKPVLVVAGEGAAVPREAVRTVKTIAKTLWERGDPAGVFSAELEVRMGR